MCVPSNYDYLVSWLNYRSIPLTTGLYTVAIHAGGSTCSVATFSSLLSTVIVDVFEIESVDMTREVSALIC